MWSGKGAQKQIVKVTLPEWYMKIIDQHPAQESRWSLNIALDFYI